MLAVVLAIVLGVGFVAATLVFGATFRASLGAAVSARYVPTDVVVNGDGSLDQQELLAAMRDVAGVDYAEYQPSTQPQFASAEARGVLRLDTIPDDPRLRWFDLDTGSWPSSADQILIDAGTAASANLQLGSPVTITGYDGTPRTVTVVGIADTTASAFSGAQNQAFAAGSLIGELDPTDDSGPIVAIAASGVSAAQLRDDVAAAVPAGATVLTAAAQIDKDLARITGGATVLTIVLLGFAVTAVVASGIVIANTFTILLTQRRRHIALTRCIGGSRGQVRREVLAEAVLVGAIGAAIGVSAGAVVGALGARLAGLDAAGAVLPALPLVFTGLGGVAFTALAAYAPASRAMRIAPLAALRPVADTAEQKRSSVLRLTVAGGLTLAGVVLMVASVTVPALLLGMAGGALSACGILLLTRTFLPAALRIVGRLGGVFGPPGRLAAANSHRNPGRAAATTAALMLGVGLIVTMQVGASSAQASLDRNFA
jgi:putative ABC transport system permease protein